MGAALFWMWWNLTGLLVAVAVAVGGSRLMAAPDPEQLVGTTLDAAALRLGIVRQRGPIVLLLAWAAAMAGVATWLGVR